MLVQGITQADFDSWKHHPVSKVILRFYRDKKDIMEQAAIQQWIAGVMTLGDQALRGQIIELDELSNMPFEALIEFYGEDKEERFGATKTIEDDTR